MIRWSCTLLLALVGLGCTAGDSDGSSARLESEVLLEGLSGPTQLAVAHDGSWWLALLNGGENDGTGQVVRLDPGALRGGSAEPEIVVDGLDKPTGVAVWREELWILERDRLTRGPLDGSTRFVVAEGLPSNGRSEGTLTVDDERLLYDTSGSLADGEVAPGSGRLWAVVTDGSELGTVEVASGFKHAYAQVRSADEDLWSTEISDGRYDGEPAADELVEVVEGTDHGWPGCVGDNRVVAELDGSCEGVGRPLAVFRPGATPTSVAAAPWDPATLVVALWNAGEVVAVPIVEADRRPVEPVLVFSDAERPQHLVAEQDRLLLVDFGSGGDDGRILALRP